MASARVPRSWESVSGPLTDETTWATRRQILRAMGFLELSSLAAASIGCQPASAARKNAASGGRDPDDDGEPPVRTLARGEDPGAVPPYAPVDRRGLGPGPAAGDLRHRRPAHGLRAGAARRSLPPRWSQASERLIEKGRQDPMPTRLYNGYGEQVAHLYA